MHHYFTYVEASIKNGIAFQAWDDGGQFGIYNRDARVWPEIKDMLIYTFPDSPTGMRFSRSGGSSITLSWENRTELTHKLLVQRRLPNTVFRTITELDQGTTTYIDTDIISDQAYDYRIIADVKEGTSRYSYPIRVN